VDSDVHIIEKGHILPRWKFAHTDLVLGSLITAAVGETKEHMRKVFLRCLIGQALDN